MPKRPTQADWARFSKGLLSDLEALADAYAVDGDALGWYAAFHRRLVEAHTEASVLGRQRAGTSGPEDVVDRLMGRAAADAQNEYLHDFMEKLGSGGYLKDGEIDLDAIKWRSGMYAQAALGTANEAWLAGGDPDEDVYWRRRAAESCEDCVEWADDSPYKRKSLAIVPGGGHTRCVTNCECYLQAASGIGFRKAV